MGHVELSGVCFDLPDGRPLLTDISFRVGDGAVVALVGANGSGKTTLTRIISGELDAHEGTVSRSGGLGVMRQFIGSIRDESTVRDLLFSLSPPRIAAAADAVDALELALMDDDSEEVNLAYAAALAEYADAGGYDQEVLVRRVLHGRPGPAVGQGTVARDLDAVGRRAEAAGPGGPAARARRGVAPRRARQLPRRARQTLAGGAGEGYSEDGPSGEPRS